MTKAMRTEMCKYDARVLELQRWEEREDASELFPEPRTEAYWNHKQLIDDRYYQNLYNLYLKHKLKVPYDVELYINSMKSPEARAEYYTARRER
jgi:hypothetical protein